MALWLTFAAMTAAAVLVVSRPLGRPSRVARGGSDLLVYKDQLREIDGDRSAGLIGEAEAEAARLEVSRRLLAAAEAQASEDAGAAAAAARESAEPQGLLRRRVAAIAVFTMLALAPMSLYLALGSPGVPAQPASARVKTPQGHGSIASLVSQVEARLTRNPGDGAGWEVIAPVYMRLGRFDDAVEARRKSLALNGESATREADLGEALVAAANGIVTTEARQSFERAVAGDRHEARARYFLGLAAEQDGKIEEASAIWRALLADATPGATWVEFVRAALARTSGASFASAGANEAADAANLNEEQRREMIHGMVARLAERLHDNGGDVDGWLRLIRAYAVLGDRDNAKGAAADAKRALADHPDDIGRIDDLVKGLGLEG